VARLIRSKGVGVYFVTQNPDDIPEDILGQLGNRVQHALRAFTARDRRALAMAAETYRDNPRFSIEDAIREVGVGEAVTSFLEKKGIPGMAERTLIRPPSSQLGPITEAAGRGGGEGGRGGRTARGGGRGSGAARIQDGAALLRQPGGALDIAQAQGR